MLGAFRLRHPVTIANVAWGFLGAFRIGGERLFWKIDHYDCELVHGSDDPANPAMMRRVMTIMLASEYK